ncbi:MAG: lactoylglutathione lyase-related protein [Rhodobacteraceae bacterium HLUCCA12]|nr:MAG: lactoylglutathione lyase-related protein [Rhodobacteraceae bacterium HLUCCA12]
MKAPTPINYVELSSSDRAASQRFFEHAFGWQFTDYGPAYCGFDNAGIDGGIAQATDGAVAASALVVLFAEDLDAARRAIEDAGGEITVAPFDFPGGRRFHFREPGGTDLAVWAQPAPG